MAIWTFNTHNKGLRDLDNMHVWNVWADCEIFGKPHHLLVINNVNKKQAEHICKMHNSEAVQQDSVSKQEFRDQQKV